VPQEEEEEEEKMSVKLHAPAKLSLVTVVQ
jgi:hypothetical protein